VISEAEDIVRSESSDQEIVDVAGQIDGQLPKKVVADPTKGISKFEFDHRTAIQPRPWHEGNDEQWMLYMSSGDVFTYRADGRSSRDRKTRPQPIRTGRLCDEFMQRSQVGKQDSNAEGAEGAEKQGFWALP
jgi:hypothetical protein